MSAKQKTIEQDNAKLQQLIQAVQDAQDAWTSAGEAWGAGKTAETTQALDSAINQHHRATTELAIHMASWWKAGYRLCR